MPRQMEKLEKHSLNLEAPIKYGTDLTKMAQEGKLDPVIGRKKQIERVTQILCKRRRSNACLIGDPGVGKTVIAEGLAQGIFEATVPTKLLGKKIFSIDIGRLIAGAANRGEFEERLTKVVDEVRQSQGSIILFIDKLHTLIGAGSGGQVLDVANILKPALARGIEECTLLLKEVSEPIIDEIRRGFRKKYEVHHAVRREEEALIACTSLSK